ncbi:MAG: hypothetical protein U0521_18810 [Anaerolineae bacterium]
MINCYSVLPVIFSEGNVYRFFDRRVSQVPMHALLGDIPNVSTRKRFFSLSAARSSTAHHDRRAACRRVQHARTRQADDAVLMSLVMRARAAGFNAYRLPLASNLPLANRREDLLIYKP